MDTSRAHTGAFALNDVVLVASWPKPRGEAVTLLYNLRFVGSLLGCLQFLVSRMTFESGVAGPVRDWTFSVPLDEASIGALPWRTSADEVEMHYFSLTKDGGLLEVDAPAEQPSNERRIGFRQATDSDS